MALFWEYEVLDPKGVSVSKKPLATSSYWPNLGFYDAVRWSEPAFPYAACSSTAR